MPPARFEPTISAGDRRQAYVLDRAATGIGEFKLHEPISLHKHLHQRRLIIQNYNFVCCFLWVRNLVARIEGRTQAEDV